MALDKYGQLDIATQLQQAVAAKDAAKVNQLSLQREEKRKDPRYANTMSTADYLKTLGWNTEPEQVQSQSFTPVSTQSFTPVQAQAFTPTDNTAQIQALAEAKKRDQIARLSRSKDQALNQISGTRAGLAPKYNNIRNSAATGIAQGFKSFKEYVAQKGLSNSGTLAQREMADNIALVGQVGAANLSEAQDNAALDRNMLDINQNYMYDVQSANAGVDSEMLAAQIAEMQRMDQLRQQQANLDRNYGLEQQQVQRQQQDDRVKAFTDTIGAYYNDYAAQINKVQNDGDTSNDWQIPYLQAARQQKLQDIENQKILAAQQQQQTQQKQQEALYDKAWDKWTKNAPLTASEYQVLGIPQGTKYVPPKNTTPVAKNPSTPKPKEPTKTEQYNADFSSDYAALKSMRVSEAAKAMNDNWSAMIQKYGPEGAVKLWNTVMADAIAIGQAKKK